MSVCMFVRFCLYCSLCALYSVDYNRVSCHHLHLCRSHESKRCWRINLNSQNPRKWKNDCHASAALFGFFNLCFCTQHTCTSIAAFRFLRRLKHIDSYRKRCSQSTFDRFSVGCIIFSFCFSVFVSVRNSVLSLPALALQPIIERGKQSWPFASSLVVSFWVGEERLKKSVFVCLWQGITAI